MRHDSLFDARRNRMSTCTKNQFTNLQNDTSQCLQNKAHLKYSLFSDFDEDER